MQFAMHPLLRRYHGRVKEDLTATYARNLHKWLLIAPLIGLTTGLAITVVAVILLRLVWPPVLGYYLHHHWAIVPGLVLGCTSPASSCKV
jgi:CIC family chloride channel protein